MLGNVGSIRGVIKSSRSIVKFKLESIKKLDSSLIELFFICSKLDLKNSRVTRIKVDKTQIN